MFRSTATTLYVHSTPMPQLCTALVAVPAMTSPVFCQCAELEHPVVVTQEYSV